LYTAATSLRSQISTRLQFARHKRGLCRHALSVCPFVTFVHYGVLYCIETSKHPQTLFHGRIATSPFYSSYTSGCISMATLLPGRQMHGIWNNRDFRPICRFVSKTIQLRYGHIWHANRNLYAICRIVLTSNDLEWPLTQMISRSRYYWKSNNSKMVQDRAIFTMG